MQPFANTRSEKLETGSNRFFCAAIVPRLARARGARGQWLPFHTSIQRWPLSLSIIKDIGWRTEGLILQKCKETSKLMWLSLIWFTYFIFCLFVCWNSFCTIASFRIKCVTETKNVSVLFYKNPKSSIWFWGFFTLLDTLAHGVALGSRLLLRGIKYKWGTWRYSKARLGISCS